MNGTYKNHTDEYLRKILDFFIWEDPTGKIGLKGFKRADKESEFYSIMTKENIKTKYFCNLENNLKIKIINILVIVGSAHYIN